MSKSGTLPTAASQSIGDRYLVERQSLIEKSRQAPMLDGVFAVLLYNEFRRRLGPPPYAEPVELTEAFPSATEAELEHANAKAKKLLSSAYRVGDALLTHHFNNSAEVNQQLLQEHPGFSDSSYEETIHYGCFHAMW